jgi:hypothetical protein
MTQSACGTTQSACGTTDSLLLLPLPTGEWGNPDQSPVSTQWKKNVVNHNVVCSLHPVGVGLEERFMSQSQPHPFPSPCGERAEESPSEIKLIMTIIIPLKTKRNGNNKKKSCSKTA